VSVFEFITGTKSSKTAQKNFSKNRHGVFRAYIKNVPKKRKNFPKIKKKLPIKNFPKKIKKFPKKIKIVPKK
jgi:hypothetical protein